MTSHKDASVHSQTRSGDEAGNVPTTATRVATRYRPILIARLEKHGFSQTEAEAWTPLSGNAFWTRADILKTACDYRDAGFDVHRARDWARIHVTHDQATKYEDADWTPHNVWNLRRTLHNLNTNDQRSPAEQTPFYPQDYQTEAEVWINTGIPATLAPLYLRAGYTPSGAELVDERRRAGDTNIVGAITVLAALKDPQPATPISDLGYSEQDPTGPAENASTPERPPFPSPADQLPTGVSPDPSLKQSLGPPLSPSISDAPLHRPGGG
jgi:hypothetical protein